MSAQKAGLAGDDIGIWEIHIAGYMITFCFSVAGEKHEGGVQMPRRERILRAQNLLAVSCFFPNGAYWHSIEMGNFNLSS